MRILIHGINYAPEQIATGKYTTEMAEWLAQRGHSVRVVTAFPYYPEWRIHEGYKARQYMREKRSGVDVFRCPLYVPRSPTGLQRILHLLSFAVMSFPVMLLQLLWRPGTVIVIEPPLLCAPQGLLVARLAGARACLHIQDFEIEAFFGLGFSSSTVLHRLIRRMEAWLMRRFDLISTISNTMLARVIEMRIPEQSAFLFPNWVDTEHIVPEPRGRDIRADWGIEKDRMVVLYSGNMGNKQGLETVLEVASRIQNTRSDVIFLLVGEGSEKAKLVAEAETRGLRNVLFKPLQPLRDLPALLASADVHLVVQKRGVADAVMPSKLTGILAVGGFSLIAADAQTELGQLVVRNPGIAVLIEPENADALYHALMELPSDRRSKGGYNVIARRFAEDHLTKNRVLGRFERKLNELR